MSISVNIKKNFDKFSLDVEFEADSGVTALLGASGCGKSMTLRCIAGVQKPSEGRIVLNDRIFFDSGKRINLSPQDRRVGLLFQNYALFPNMTVEQNIMAGCVREKNRDAKIEKCKSLIASFYLSGLEKHYPWQLSGGQQQRVAISRILAGDPDILMLDEPFAALDSYLKWQLEQELMDTLKAFSGITIYVSHNRDEVYRLCDRVCVIDNGKSEKILPTKTMFEHPKTLSAARLSGCKNIAYAHLSGENQVYVTDWGVTLEYDPKDLDGLGDVRYIGVRAHHILLKSESDHNTIHNTIKSESDHNIIHNTIKCRVERIVDDLFSTIVVFSPLSGNGSDFSHIRVEAEKEEMSHLKIGDIAYLKIEKSALMLLE